jgi:hypothetical protein
VNKSLVPIFCSSMCCHNTPLHFFFKQYWLWYPAWFAGNSLGPVFVTSHRVIILRKWAYVVTTAFLLGGEDYICIA